jgi:hypothetical protein
VHQVLNSLNISIKATPSAATKARQVPSCMRIELAAVLAVAYISPGLCLWLEGIKQ